MQQQKFKYYIYQITNNLNGKIYIGQHKVPKNGEPLNRYMGKGIAIREAIKKYGKENFSKTILQQIEDDEKHQYVSEREIFWIKQLNCISPNGYNISPGGEGGATHESGMKGALTRKQNGYKHSQQTKEKMSIASKGKKKSEIHKQHLSEHHRSRKLHIISFEDGRQSIQTYDAVNKIAKKFNITAKKLTHNSAAGNYCNGIRLDDYIGKNFVDNYLNKDEKQLLLNSKFFDPIRNDKVSYFSLIQRKHYHKDEYKNIIVKNQRIK